MAEEPKSSYSTIAAIDGVCSPHTSIIFPNTKVEATLVINICQPLKACLSIWFETNHPNESMVAAFNYAATTKLSPYLGRHVFSERNNKLF